MAFAVIKHSGTVDLHLRSSAADNRLVTQVPTEVGPARHQMAGWVAFAWCRLAILALVALALAVMALQLIPYEVNRWGLEGRSLGDSIIGVSLGLLPLIVPVVVLVRRRRKGLIWLRTLRTTFWVMVVVALLPAYMGAMSTII